MLSFALSPFTETVHVAVVPLKVILGIDAVLRCVAWAETGIAIKKRSNAANTLPFSFVHPLSVLHIVTFFGSDFGHRKNYFF